MDRRAAERLIARTPEAVNERLRARAAMRIADAADGDPAAREAAARRLEKEWDVERALQAGAAGLSLFALAAAAAGRRRWAAAGLLGPALLLGGGSLAGELLRCVGLRTAMEIEEEAAALRDLEEG